MERIKFIKGSIAAGFAFFAAPFIHSASSQNSKSTYDRLEVPNLLILYFQEWMTPSVRESLGLKHRGQTK